MKCEYFLNVLDFRRTLPPRHFCGIVIPSMKQDTMLRISTRSLAFAAVILLLLMTATGIITRTIPPGSYERAETDIGEQILEGSFSFTDKPPLPVWRWYTAPAEVLFGPDAPMIIIIVVFMCLVAGAVSVLNTGGILQYLIARIIHTFQDTRYLMEGVIILALMLFGSILGTMEEVVVLVPLLTALAVRMGWDPLTGLGLSLGAAAFGFAAALTNPFTIGVAQRLAGVPLFSGFLYRLVIFIVIYLVYSWYVISQSSKSELVISAPSDSPDMEHTVHPKKQRALRWFFLWMGIMGVCIIVLARIPSVSDLILPAVIISFLAGGVGAGALSGLSRRDIGTSFGAGALGISPGIILILMASSIKHIMTGSGSMDTILHFASGYLSQAGPYGAALIIYGLVLVLNFFISSGSAKAFLVIPLITPAADMAGLSRQTAVLAYQFGDGFSNILYPTNALLLICLAITGISYWSWFKWIWKIQLVLFCLSILFLLGAVRFGYS